MKNVLIINAHQKYSWAKGTLTTSIIELQTSLLTAKGYDVRHSDVSSDYDVNDEVEKIFWADIVILQSPTYWMGLPWMAKKYVDEVFNAGVPGKLGKNDGRVKTDPKKNYGTGGLSIDKRYMLSITCNAPEEAFNSPEEFLYQGKSIDDLWFAQHMAFKFIGMKPIETFACYDVMKNPEIEKDFANLKKHINKHF